MSKDTEGVPGLKKVLVAVDGSKYSEKALAVAAALAKRQHSDLAVLHVFELPLMWTTKDGVLQYQYPQDVLETIRQEADKLVQENVRKAESFGIGARGVVLSGEGSVVGTIVSYAEENGFDLIVLGTRGLGGFKRLLLGSVSSGVASHAHCSVLIVK
jgi:nucleotide-binding universal stress UspA family protein